VARKKEREKGRRGEKKMGRRGESGRKTHIMLTTGH
jgi:hypothetical protein